MVLTQFHGWRNIEFFNRAEIETKEGKATAADKRMHEVTREVARKRLE
jgi:hypothetical protein